MDRMHGFGPQFIDVTWGAGWSPLKADDEMVKVAQNRIRTRDAYAPDMYRHGAIET